ncbi:hypothetical protein GCM10023196_016960 [Actinoallomurus vinaceus]|uniref:Uncharacterized protein n=1 Tax=Actinoallomurus vinaceus TaxID=1080074 RepID=A0ABP8U3U6_9ACTN
MMWCSACRAIAGRSTPGGTSIINCATTDAKSSGSSWGRERRSASTNSEFRAHQPRMSGGSSASISNRTAGGTAASPLAACTGTVCRASEDARFRNLPLSRFQPCECEDAEDSEPAASARGAPAGEAGVRAGARLAPSSEGASVISTSPGGASAISTSPPVAGRTAVTGSGAESRAELRSVDGARPAAGRAVAGRRTSA